MYGPKGKDKSTRFRRASSLSLPIKPGFHSFSLPLSPFPPSPETQKKLKTTINDDSHEGRQRTLLFYSTFTFSQAPAPAPPAMKDRRRRIAALSWSSFFWFTFLLVVSSALFINLTYFPHFFFRESFHPSVVLTWPSPTMEAKSSDSPVTSGITVRETVLLPDQALLFLNYPPSSRLYTQDDLHCVYLKDNSSPPQLTLPLLQIDQTHLNEQIVRCRLHPRGYKPSLVVESNGPLPTNPSNHKWYPLAYEGLIDHDNTTIVFVKGLNLRPEKVAEPSRYECLFGWDFRRPKYLLTSDVVSVAQEIVRCRTPLSILSGDPSMKDSVKVSVRVEGRGIFPSVARLRFRPQVESPTRKVHRICVCTMLRNQARFIKEWVMYHSRIGVQRWFIYDNNSDDDIRSVIEFLQDAGYNITRQVWPWIKTQEAGFAHCALGAREVCEWVGFIDVDEFFNVKLEGGLWEVIRAESRVGKVGEIRTGCYSFGPSGLKEVPGEGVMVGYTCRMAGQERHKSIVRPEALKENLINVVHHFHLKEAYVAVDVESRVMVINHYKYQVWKVFRDKFYRRVATYVTDWREGQNITSRDRVPGLSTSSVEPPDWSNRFCEIRDVDLRVRVLKMFGFRRLHLLPWQAEYENYVRRRRRRRRRGKRKRNEVLSTTTTTTLSGPFFH